MVTKVNASQISHEAGSVKDVLDTVKPFSNYAQLRSYSGNATQVRITDPGIAGFFYLDGVTTTTTEDNGGTTICAASIGAKRWKRVFEGEFRVSWWGAIGDGITNDSATIQAALNSVPFGGKFRFDAGKTYLINTPIQCHHVKEIDGNGAVFKYTNSCIKNNQFGFSVGKTKTTYTSLSISAVGQRTSFTSPGGIPFAVGNLILLKSTDVRLVNGISNYLHGMWAVVSRVVDNTIYLNCSFYETFTISSVEIYNVPSGLKISNLTLDMTATTSDCFQNFAGIDINGANVEISNINLYANDFSHTGIRTNGIGFVITNISGGGMLNTQGLPLPGRTGYGVAVGSSNTIVSSCVLHTCKHAIAAAERNWVITGLTYAYNAVSEDIINGAAHGYTGSLDIHHNHAGAVNIIGNEIKCYGVAFTIRNGKARVQGNTILQSGISAPIISSAEVGYDYLDISGGNRIFMYSTTSFLIGNYTSQTALSVITANISDNFIQGGNVLRVDAPNTSINKVTIINNELNNLAYIAIIQNIVLSDKLEIIKNKITGANFIGSFACVKDVADGSSFFNTVISENIVDSSFTFVDITRDNLNIDSFVIDKNTLRSTNRILNLTTDSVSVKRLSVTNNLSLSSASTEATFPITISSKNNKTTTFINTDISSNYIDNNLNTGASTPILISNCSFTQSKVQHNTAIRSTGDARGILFTRLDATDVSVIGNYCNGDIRINSSTIQSTFTRVNIENNTCNALSFDEGTTDLIYISLKIINNITQQILIVARSGTTGWLSSDDFCIENNTCKHPSGAGIYIGPDAIGNKVRIIGGTYTVAPTDTSATFYKIPTGAVVPGGSISWKGGVSVFSDGRMYRSAAPTTGAWSVGEEVYYLTPVAGGFRGLVCTTAGTPGTWKTFGVISA